MKTKSLSYAQMGTFKYRIQKAFNDTVKECKDDTFFRNVYFEVINQMKEAGATRNNLSEIRGYYSALTDYIWNELTEFCYFVGGEWYTASKNINPNTNRKRWRELKSYDMKGHPNSVLWKNADKLYSPVSIA